jgi:hypothetical protein
MEVGEEGSQSTIRVGPLEPDEDGNQYIMVAVDELSRYVRVMFRLEPAKDATGESAAHFVLKIGMFSRPKGIRTDGLGVTVTTSRIGGSESP